MANTYLGPGFGSIFKQVNEAFVDCIDTIIRRDEFMQVENPKIPSFIKTYIKNIQRYFLQSKKQPGFIVIDKDDCLLIIALTPFIIGCNKMLVVSNSNQQVREIERSIIGNIDKNSSVYMSIGIFDDDVKKIYTPSVMMVKPETAYMLHGYSIYNANAKNIILDEGMALYDKNCINLANDRLKEFDIDLVMINNMRYEAEHQNLKYHFDKSIYIVHDINNVPSPEQLICDIRKFPQRE